MKRWKAIALTDVLTVERLSKEFPSEFVLGPLSFEVKPGETIAILGKNGAGKTTLFQLVTGNMDPTAGSIKVLGKKLTPDSYQLKRKVGYLPQKFPFAPWVSPYEVLRYGEALLGLGMSRNEMENQLLYWDCTDFASRPFSLCSHGMKKRVGLALATIHSPELLVLDEPFSGLDLYHIKALERLITQRKGEGKTTILSTHIAQYVAMLCERVLVLDNGQIETLTPWIDLSLVDRIQKIEEYFFGKENQKA